MSTFENLPQQAPHGIEVRRDWWTPLPVDEVREGLADDVPKEILVLGCGVREIAAYLEEMPEIEGVVGVDTEEDALKATYDEVQRVRPGFQGLELVPGDATILGSLHKLGTDRFGVVTSTALWANVYDFNALFHLMLNARDALIQGGSYVVSDFICDVRNRRWWRHRYHRDADAMEALHPHSLPMFGVVVTRPFGMNAVMNLERCTQNDIEQAIEREEYGRLVRHWDERVYTRVLRTAQFDIATERRRWVSEVGEGRGTEQELLLNVIVRAVKADWRDLN